MLQRRVRQLSLSREPGLRVTSTSARVNRRTCARCSPPRPPSLHVSAKYSHARPHHPFPASSHHRSIARSTGCRRSRGGHSGDSGSHEDGARRENASAALWLDMSGDWSAQLINLRGVEGIDSQSTQGLQVGGKKMGWNLPNVRLWIRQGCQAARVLAMEIKLRWEP
jgi:hypothetical protein